MEHKYFTVTYDLYVTDEGEKELIESATEEQPFQFISNLGGTLEAFEEQVAGLNPGDSFNFTLTPDQAYGEYDPNHVIELEKGIFEIDGRFDDEEIYPGNVIPLNTSDGRRILGEVVEVKDDVVVMDLNHPYAGDTMIFEGKVLEARTATDEEVQGMLNLISGGGGCNCGCEGECDEEGCEGGCGGGHSHGCGGGC